MHYQGVIEFKMQRVPCLAPDVRVRVGVIALNEPLDLTVSKVGSLYERHVLKRVKSFDSGKIAY